MPNEQDRPIEELVAAYAFVDEMKSSADSGNQSPFPYWHGWALRDAFFAGIDYAKAQEKQEDTCE